MGFGCKGLGIKAERTEREGEREREGGASTSTILKNWD